MPSTTNAYIKDLQQAEGVGDSLVINGCVYGETLDGKCFNVNYVGAEDLLKSPLKYVEQAKENNIIISITPGELAEEIAKFPNSLVVTDNVKNLGQRIVASHSQGQNKMNR